VVLVHLFGMSTFSVDATDVLEHLSVSAMDLLEHLFLFSTSISVAISAVASAA